MISKPGSELKKKSIAECVSTYNEIEEPLTKIIGPTSPANDVGQGA